MVGLQRSADAYFEVVDDKAVIVDPAGAELLTLNRVGTVVWHALDGERDEAALVEQLAARYPDVPRATLTTDLRKFLAELEGANLLER
jgi:hypothetical protein